MNGLAPALGTLHVDFIVCRDVEHVRSAAPAVVIVVPDSRQLPDALQVVAALVDSEHPHPGLILVDDDWMPQRKRLEAIRSGYDHCLGANVEPEELAGVVFALVRKRQRNLAPATLTWGPIEVDFIRGFAWVDGDRVELQPLQLRILGLLMAHAGDVVSNEQLLDAVFRARPASANASIARQISVLRHHLGRERGMLVTVPGGYCLRVRAAGSSEL